MTLPRTRPLASLALAAAAALTGCSPLQVHRLGPADQAAVERSLAVLALSRQTCLRVDHPATAAERSAAAEIIRIATAQPRSLYRSPDFANAKIPMRELRARLAEVATACVTGVPRTSPSWKRIAADLAAGAETLG